MFMSPTMQSNFFNGIGPQNTVTYIPFQTPVQSNVQYPEIIGEGDVASVVLPNGSVQYFFIPTIKRDVWPPCAYALPTVNVNWNIASQAWFIRNISNPIAPSCCFGQQYLRPYGDYFNANIMPSECNPNSPALAYSNTFHYDRCTSTADLQCFSPRPQSRHQQTSAAPITPTDDDTMQTCLYDVVCCNPCPCRRVSGNIKYCQDDVEKETARLQSAMSIEDMDRKGCCCACPSKKSFDKSVCTLRDSTSEENSKEITLTKKTKVLESSKMKVLGKEKSISTIKSKESRVSKKSSPMEVIKMNKANQHDTEIIKSSAQKLEKSEESCCSDKGKLTDKLKPKPKKEGKGKKEKKKRAKCCCEEDSGDESDTKSYGNGRKPSCCCRRRRNKGVVSDNDTDKKSDKDKNKNKDRDITELESGKQLSLIQIMDHCDHSCCCSECATK